MEYATGSWGDAFRAAERASQWGDILVPFVLGKDLPLNEDILCHLALTEWLLERPSQLYITEAQP